MLQQSQIMLIQYTSFSIHQLAVYGSILMQH